MVSGVDCQRRNCILVVVSVTVGCRGRGGLYCISHTDRVITLVFKILILLTMTVCLVWWKMYQTVDGMQSCAYSKEPVNLWYKPPLVWSQKRMVVEWGLIYRDKQGKAEWSQVLIVREGIVSWLWLVSLLGAGDVGVYTVSHILIGWLRWSSRYWYYSLWQCVWCDERCTKRLMGCRVVLTPRNLWIYGISHHLSGHGKFRYIYLGISFR